jgi:hypothetical protein
MVLGSDPGSLYGRAWKAGKRANSELASDQAEMHASGALDD